MFEVFPKKLADLFVEKLDKNFQGNKDSFEVYYDKRYFIVNSTPLKEGSNINKVLLVMQDITDRKNAEKEIEKALNKERELSGLKSRFVSMASHEFRTPLGTILSSVSLIDKYKEKAALDKMEKHIVRVKSNVEYLTQVLDEFLTIGRFEEGKIQNVPEKTELISFLRHLIEEFLVTPDLNKSILIDTDVDKLELFIDPKLLRTVLTNLLSNAIKYSYDNTIIYLNVDYKHPYLDVSIKDSGIGIPESDQKHLFDVFFRASNSSNIKGTGLGLNIVKNYIEILNGSLDFESTENVGTTFYLKFNVENITCND